MAEHAQNRARSARGRPFLPGVSGNPGGRPKGFAARVRELTRDGEDVLGVVVAILHDDRTPARVRLDASRLLLDRGWGRVLELATDSAGADDDRCLAAEADLARLEALDAELKRRRAAA